MIHPLAIGLLSMVLSASACLAEPPAHPLCPVPLGAVTVNDGFWKDRLEINRKVTIPHVFRMCEETGRIDNFSKAARKMPGSFRGAEFDDSDVFKAVEAASYTLVTRPDAKLDADLDALIAKIVAAQEPDGYLYTARTIHPDDPPRKAGSKRWLNECGDLIHLQDSHELYNLGHLIEAGIAHHQATGKRTLLDAAIKAADLVAAVWGPGKLEIPPGHQEIELALVRLHDLTGKQEYLALARFLLECRGRGKGQPDDFYANRLPVAEQRELVGHAVRSVYMCCALADLAARTGDAGYRRVLDCLWTDMSARKLSLTGGLGASPGIEGMGPAYDLPTAKAHNETCASLANVWWNHRMFLLTGDGRYLDVLERSLYNGALVGVSLAGDNFFYVNPLASDGKEPFNHGHSERFPWTAIACCPPNLARFFPQVPGFAYATCERSVYTALYLAGNAKLTLGDGEVVRLHQQTGYPWDGEVRIEVLETPLSGWELKLHIPGWAVGQPVPSDLYTYLEPAAPGVALRVNGQPVEVSIQQGFAGLKREWKRGDVVELTLPMPVRRVVPHELVRENIGYVALERGPIVYCVEGVDHGGRVSQLVLEAEPVLREERHPSALGAVSMLRGTIAEACRGKDGSVALRPAELTAIPYFAWCNRGANPMAVWLPRSADKSVPIPYPTLASGSRPIASWTFDMDTVAALNDQVLPAASNDETIPRFTWWDHQGTKEWVQYDFPQPSRVRAVEVYWFDDAQKGLCRVPDSWSLSVFDGTSWKPLLPHAPAGVEKDRFNRVDFDPVMASSLRLDTQLQQGFSAGIFEWRVTE